MKTSAISNNNKSWVDEEVVVLKRIVKHARRDGKTFKEAFEQAAFRLERTYGAVYGFWHQNIDDDFKQYVKSIEKLTPAPVDTTKYATQMEEAFKRVETGYAVDDLPFADAGDYTGDIDPHPEQYHPPKSFVEQGVENTINSMIPDTRYNIPRLSPKASETDVENAIDETIIYSLTRDEMLNAQRRQVAYGLDKYPEPLNADTWTIIETIDHIISETADKLHYLTMLKIKLQQGTEE